MSVRFEFPVLIGDVGGTNARFALIEEPGAAPTRYPNVGTSDYATFSEAMRAAAANADVAPRSAVVALAGPVLGDSIALTNAPWVVEPRKTIERLNLKEMSVLNDFEAQSLSLPALREGDLQPIGNGTFGEATKVVVGPGTGLGAAALARAGDRWVPIPGEGGHIDIGPMSERDRALWPHLERYNGRISAEGILSGGGVVRLYRALCAADGVAPRFDNPEAITKAGLATSDALAAETLHLFATYLGRVAGDLAMIFLARGGVYLAGGISSKIAPALAQGAFLEAFVDKAPHGDLLASIGTAIVTSTDAALTGLAALVRDPESYVLDLSGRTWRA